MLLMKLAYRNLWRNRRRTLLTMTAIGVATALVILMLAIYDGMMWDMIDSATDMYHGHVKVTAENYLDKRKMQLTIGEDGVRGILLAGKGVKGVAGRVRGFALISYGEGDDAHTQPAELFGIDPAEERTVTRLDEALIEGSFVTASDSDEIVLGDGLAKRLEAEVGGEIVMMGQAADGSIAAGLFTVVGILETGDPLRDASLAVVGRKTLQGLLALEGRIHEWSVSLRRPIGADVWAAEMAAKLPGMDVVSWYTFLPLLKQSIDLWDVSEWIFAFIFYFAVILIAANTMYMAFFERMREFGVIEAIGMKSGKLSLLIVLEGMIMSGLAALAGGAVGIAVALFMVNHHIDLSAFISPITYGGGAFQPRLKTYPTFKNMIVPILMITALGIIVALFPARKLKKLKPVDVLKEV